MEKYNERILRIKNLPTRAFMKYLWRQVHINRFGFFGIITGLPGMGKSETALLLAWLQDETFDVSKLKDVYIRSAKDFIKRIDDADTHEWLVWGETALSLSSQKWYSLSNMIVDDVIQTMRTKELGVVFDTPNIGHIDKRARELFQWFTEVHREEQSPVRWKLHRIEVSQRYKKMLFPHPLFNINGNMVKLKEIIVKGRLPPIIIEKFDKLHKGFKNQLIKGHAKKIELLEREERGFDIWEVIEKVNSNQQNYANKWGKLDKDMIMLKDGVSRDRAVQIVKFIEKQ